MGDRLIFQTLVVFLVSIIFFIDIALAGEVDNKKEIYMHAEVEGIQSSACYNNENAFCIEVFDCLVSVPKRFVLVSSSKFNHSFNSMQGVVFGGVFLNGDIVTGSVKLSSGEKIFEFNPEEYELNEFTAHGIRNVKIYTKIIPGTRLIQVLVTDESEYLLISDENPDLWKAILKSALPIK